MLNTIWQRITNYCWSIWTPVDFKVLFQCSHCNLSTDFYTNIQTYDDGGGHDGHTT